MNFISEHLFILLVFIFAALLHGISGIGFPLVTTTAVASSHTLSYAIILVLFPALVMNLMSWLVGGGRTVWQNLRDYGRKYWLLALMSLIGSLFGAKLLLWINSAYLLLLLALAITFYVITSMLGKVIYLPDTKPILITVGLLAGIIGGATNAMSPILLMYLLSASNDKHTITKVGNMCYFIGKLAQIIVLREPIMALSSNDWGLIALLTLLSIGGLIVGIRLRHYLPQARFRQLILLILALLGLKVGWQGITAIAV
ncbi:sulfite exporter TauE/SafE family protein [Cardiobacteriaceae bacterium TAE3-ERU3]|nr:sulfite exporter TauE/SafE family protein [Cardiobacteriaceae bacterium TAE3-ERU3]